jgi:hypothetical protein
MVEGGEGARSKRKMGLASVRARAWRASTCSDIVVLLGIVGFAGLFETFFFVTVRE